MGEVQNPKTSAVADIPEYLDPVYQRAVLRGLRDGVVRGVKKEKNLFISAGAIFTWYQLQGALQRRSFNHRISQFCNPNPNAASNAWKTYQDFIHRSSPLLSSGTRRFVTYGASYGVPLYLKNEALQGIDPKSEGANSLGPRIATDVATLYLVDRLWAQNAPGIERFLQNHPEF